MRNAVLVVGGINVDAIYEVERLSLEHEKLRASGHVLLGGRSTAHTAHWLSQFGMPVYLAGFAGRDVFGDFAVDALVAVGVHLLPA